MYLIKFPCVPRVASSAETSQHREECIRHILLPHFCLLQLLSPSHSRVQLLLGFGLRLTRGLLALLAGWVSAKGRLTTPLPQGLLAVLLGLSLIMDTTCTYHLSKYNSV